MGKRHFREVKYSTIILRLISYHAAEEIKPFSFRQCLLKAVICQLHAEIRICFPKHYFSPARDWRSCDGIQSK